VPRLEGAFSTVVMTPDRVVAFRDPVGLRPLALGRIGDRYCVASESCAFDIIGGEFMRDVLPGEMVALSDRGIETRQVAASDHRAFCVFEHIYFARPDSMLEGKRTQVSRRRMGEILWREAPLEADLVIAVPDSGNPAAVGYSTASGIPKDDGLIKNRYVAREALGGVRGEATAGRDHAATYVAIPRQARLCGRGGSYRGRRVLAGALRDSVGFPAFRPGQREACEAALAGRDVLVVIPTGS